MGTAPTTLNAAFLDLVEEAGERRAEEIALAAVAIIRQLRREREGQGRIRVVVSRGRVVKVVRIVEFEMGPS